MRKIKYLIAGMLLVLALPGVGSESTSTLSDAAAVKTTEAALPPEVAQWLADTTSLLLECFAEQFPGCSSVNRQEVAANAAVQELLKERAEVLIATPGFVAALQKGMFRGIRRAEQPSVAVGSRPSQVNAALEMAAHHTAAGLAEIICTHGDEWEKGLQEHFIRVGQRG